MTLNSTTEERFIPAREYDQKHAELVTLVAILKQQMESLSSRLTAIEQDRGERESRLTRVEMQLGMLATREDLITLKASIATFTATVDKFATAVNLAATKTDVEWIKRAYWWGMGILSAVIVTLAGLVLAHILGKP